MRWVLALLSAGFAAAAIAVAASGGEEPRRAAAAPAATAAPASQLERGRTAFARLGCQGCHALAESTDPDGFMPGPNLGQPGLLESKTRARLRQDILDPEAEGAVDGYMGMPTDFGRRFKPGELDALITYLLSTTRQ